jgi:hypothetical protein
VKGSCEGSCEGTPWYTRKWLVQQPYPILEGDKRAEITCFGP